MSFHPNHSNLATCGFCAPCSILTGVAAAAKAAAYILCLDDDIVLHPDALAGLVLGLAADDSCFMATGKRPIRALNPKWCCIYCSRTWLYP